MLNLHLLNGPWDSWCAVQRGVNATEGGLNKGKNKQKYLSDRKLTEVSEIE